ncbi:MAG TPA: 50S ribosomal protein L13 [Thermomicrobiales bacterium]|jgi:large subunit ribosomal protein L13|nr:50S ribosomal protein L13 [Thermomicrobiales bacterium]
MAAVKTYIPKATEIERRWYIVDAEGLTLGRLATQIATIIRGKHKPSFTPHLDVGDYVIVVNAEKVHVTGNKEEQKFYYRHSGYPGGFRSTSLRDQLAKHPERVIETAVKGMIPHTNLGRDQLKKLKVFAGPNHPHAAQQPTPLEIRGASRA